jgi:hypothetical protein
VGLFDWFESQLVQLLRPVLGPIRPLVQIFFKFKDSTFGILTAGQHLVDSTAQTYGKILHFQTQPAFRTRVISVPRVADNLEALAQAPQQIIKAFEDLFAQLKNKIDPAAFDFEELEGLEDLRGIIGKLGSKFAAAFEKVLGFVTLLVDALVTIRAAIDDLQAIVDSVSTIVDDLSNLEGLFLPQSNPRKTEQLSNGGSIKIRVGSLHDS